MQLNGIVFAAPKCSYSTQSLFKELIYIPRSTDQWLIENVPLPMEAVRQNDHVQLDESIDNLRISMNMAIGDMGSYTQQQKKQSPAKTAQS